jgi:hypothetical protein
VVRPWPILLCLPLAAQDPAILQIRVVEGEGAIYPLGGRATRGITVQVTDETGRPVEAASVSFLLPDDGPGGVFSTGSKTEIVTAGADGRAAIWGMQWNRTAGRFDIRITAVKGQARAGTVCAQFLTEALAGRDTSSRASRAGPGHKWLWISLAAVGAAVGGAASTALAGKGPAAPPALSSPVRIGTPAITLGPHP